MNRISALIGKEIRHFLSDPQQLFFSFAMPLLLLAVFVGTFGNTARVNIDGYVVDLDRTAASAEFTSRIAQTEGLTLRAMTEAEAARRLERADITTYVVVPGGFAAEIAAGRVKLQINRRGNGGTDGQIFNSYAVAAASAMAAESLQQQAVLADLATLGLTAEPSQVRAVLGDYRGQNAATPLVNVREEALGQRPEMATFFLPGLVSMFAIFTVALASENIVAERKSGTLERLMTTQLTQGQLIGGKFLAFATRTYLQVLILFSIGWAWFGVFTPASFALVMLYSTAVVAAGAGLGMLIAALARTAEQAVWGSVILTNTMAMLGGSFTPIPSASVVGTLARLTPNHYANLGYKELIAKGNTFAAPAVWQSFVILAAMGAGLLIAATMLFRVRRDDR